MSPRLACLLLAAGLGGCGSCAPRSAPPALTTATLSEEDTLAVDGGVARAADGAWSLALQDPLWREVAAPVRGRLKPDVDRWFVHSGTLSSLTIRCDPGLPAPTPAALEAATRAALEAAGRPLAAFSASPVQGDWVSGAVAVWRSGVTIDPWRQVTGRFTLLDTTCELRSWASDDATLASLRALTLGFSGRRPAVLRELAQLTQALGTRLSPDAGREERVLFLASGLARLSDQELAERAHLRLLLLLALDPQDCADLIRQQNIGMDTVLAHLDDAQAVRWTQLSRRAVELGGGTPPAAEVAPEALADQVAHRPELAAALRTLARMAEAGEVELCQAERTRLRLAEDFPAASRGPILRWWLSGH